MTSGNELKKMLDERFITMDEIHHLKVGLELQEGRILEAVIEDRRWECLSVKGKVPSLSVLLVMEEVMEYKRQTDSNCVAYALWQIGAIGEDGVREYERQCIRGKWAYMSGWVEKFLPEWSQLRKELEVPYLFTGGFSSRDLDGQGIVLLMSSPTTGHVISYENGLVLDPDITEERMSLEDYLKRHPHLQVHKIIPTERKKDEI